MAQLTPIPVPRRYRWREFRVQMVPGLIFFLAIIGVVFIWRDHVSAPSFVGEVEVVRAHVISTLPGLLVEMTVDRFEQVSQGQIIGKVFPTDPEILKTALAAAEIELKMLQRQVGLDEKRNEVNYEQARMDWLGQRIALATAKVNLEYAESEYLRQAALHAEKIISNSEYELAKNIRDARREEVAEVTTMVAEGEKHLKKLALGENAVSFPTNNSLHRAIAAQEAQLLLTEGPITLTAPIDGIITSLNNRSGERVVAGVPILTITSPHSSRIVAFARQPLQLVPKIGDRVQVRTRGSPRKTAIASVVQVSSGIDVMVVPLNNNQSDFPTALGNPIERGLAFSVTMPEGLGVYPGETVDLVIVR